MAINHDELAKHFAAEPVAAERHLKEAIETGQVKPTEFNLGRLFESCYGFHDFRRIRDGHLSASAVMGRHLSETTGAVTTANFMNITGQIVYSAVLDKYNLPEFVFKNMIPTTPTQFLDGEKIAGVTQIGDEALIRNETDPYTLAGVTEDWIFTPPPRDRGLMVPLSWEAVFADRTGQLLERAGDVGTSLGLNNEKRAIDCVIDENTTTHRYNWRGTVIASYGDNSGTHTWDNLQASNALVDWTDIDAADQLFNAMLDPYTGEPFFTMPRHLIVAKQLEKTAFRIRNATEVVVTSPGYATTADPSQMRGSPNPVGGKFEVVTSALVAQRLGTDTSWFYGDVSKYARCMQIEPMNVMQAPPNSELEFTNRIIGRYRANERNAYVVVQPRAMVKNTA